ncbi:MAG: VOC family protein [Gammaproteobacteria bacterium]|nr:VOC family protein [Gammaproteobacteria bacterium]MYF27853.1 VOC family protein [Gammaproteobacteria bacterium]MYK48600.1 VOC family protein [Gammaproteobacteria bacterium]
MRTDTMLFARDVVATSRWYQDFLGMQSGHGGSEFEMLMDGDTLLLELHEIDADHNHGVSTTTPLGHGVLVFVHVDDPRAALGRARELGIEVLSDLQYNEQANMTEFTVRDPNGYAICICKSHWT